MDDRNEEWDDIKQLKAHIRALESQLAACKIARDGFTAASDTAHARVIELEAALRSISKGDCICSRAQEARAAIASQSDREIKP